ncbi:MAG: NAD(P)-dependent oxidoreductase [Alphaproteobacteria bacterium]|nr:NAD(P)-dependent oxidoreductase [Alphaproteobacteria bacterium]
MAERVGFVGLGAMGQPMASNLQRKGTALLVHDRDPSRADPLLALGARRAEGIAELAHNCDIVITMLPDSPDVEEVVAGPGGLLELGRSGQIVMDMSTIDPRMSDRLAASLAARGMGFVDAPVGRLVSHAVSGESLFMVGATPENFARVEPLLAAMGTTIHHCGPPGSGMRTKLVNNYLAIATCQLTAEAMALSEAFGLDLRTTLDVVNGTTARNGHLLNAWPSKVLRDDVAPGFRISLAHKDISLCVEAARGAGVPIFMGVAARECLGQAARSRRSDGTAFADSDFSALLDHVCEQAGRRGPRLASS